MLFSKKNIDCGEMDDALKTSASLRPSVHVKACGAQTPYPIFSDTFFESTEEFKGARIL